MKFDSEGVNNILKTNDLKINRNGVKKAIFLQNKNNNTYNSENDFYKYNNYLNNSQKYEKLNNMKNKIKFIQRSNEIKHKKIINRKIDFNKLNINQKSFVNNVSDINQMNKFYILKELNFEQFLLLHNQYQQLFYFYIFHFLMFLILNH